MPASRTPNPALPTVPAPQQGRWRLGSGWAGLFLKLPNSQGYWKPGSGTQAHRQADFTALSRAQNEDKSQPFPSHFWHGSSLGFSWRTSGGFEVQMDWRRVNLFRVSFRWIFFFNVSFWHQLRSGRPQDLLLFLLNQASRTFRRGLHSLHTYWSYCVLK